MLKYKYFYWIFIGMVFLSTAVNAQKQGSIVAKVVDNENQAIPFASVRLIRSGTGIVTNADGGFQVPAIEPFLSDSVVISCIGYKQKSFSMTSLRQNDINVIKLQTAYTKLSEIEIRSSKTRRLTGTRIVQSAIGMLSYNYPQQPFSYVAYYRDYQVKDSLYVNLNEAIVKVNDQGFSTDDQMTTSLQLVDYKANSDFVIDTLMRQPYDNVERKFIPHASLRNFAGNELVTLMVHDAIRNHNRFSFSFINKLDRDFLYNHRFSLAGQITEGDRTLYVVAFTTRDHITGQQHQGTGKIFIEKSNYRIHKLQYTTNEWKDFKLVPIYNIVVEYAHHNNTMYLNYISFSNVFRMRNHDDFKVIETLRVKNLAAFLVKFNHQPTASALNITNYTFRIDNKLLKLREVAFTQDDTTKNDYHKQVVVYVQDGKEFEERLPEHSTKVVTVEVKGVRDQRGREVNVATFFDAAQYREIFTQQLLHGESDTTKYPLIDKFTPLHKMPGRSGQARPSRFWMNTPLRTELVSKPPVQE